MSETRDTRERFAALCAHADALLDAAPLPGLAVGVLDGAARHVHTAGVTHVRHPLPVDAHTFFQIGSITKTYTGVALLRLVARGVYDLDVPLRAYLPGFAVRDAEASARATLRHLLTHTGGWYGDFFPDTGDGDDALARYVALMADLEQTLPLGQHRSYNNAGFAVAGLLVERALNKPFEQALAELVLAPLGLARTWFDPNHIMTERFAVGHFPEAGAPGGYHIARPWAMGRNISSMGRLSCDIHDVLAYAAFHLNDGVALSGERLLTPEHVALLRQPDATLGAPDVRLGFVWALDAWGDQLVQKHYGTTEGQAALLVLAPQAACALVVLTNSQAGLRVREQLYAAFAALYLGVSAAPPTPDPAAPDALHAYAGRYGSRRGGFLIRVEGATLVVQQVAPGSDAPPPGAPGAQLAPAHNGSALLMLDGPYAGRTMDVLRAPDGRLAGLRFLDRAYPPWP